MGIFTSLTTKTLLISSRTLFLILVGMNVLLHKMPISKGGTGSYPTACIKSQPE
jgi:hypothetical protein